MNVRTVSRVLYEIANALGCFRRPFCVFSP